MSAERRVLVHDCGPQPDDGNRLTCACARRITAHDAEELVKSGQAQWKLQRTTGRGLVVVYREVILCEPIQAERHPWIHARVVSERDILVAYVEGETNAEHARDRIEIIGEAQVKVLLKLGAVEAQR